MAATRTGPVTGRPPGVHPADEPEPRALSAVRMDVCAFAGVASRGPAWERTDDPTWISDAGAPRVRSTAVAVGSWTEFARTFGTDGPGLLAPAVAAFFAQGGVRAHVVRIVPSGPRPDPEPPACTLLRLPGEPDPDTGTPRPGPVVLRARNEGSWGNRLVARLEFTATPVRPPSRVRGSTLVLDPRTPVPGGSVLRLTPESGPAVLCTVTRVLARPRPDRDGTDLVAVLDTPPPQVPLRAEVVEGVLEVRDRDPRGERAETFAGLGLTDGHPRWAGTRLHEASALVEVYGPVTALLPATPELAPVAVGPDPDEPGGRDRYAEIALPDVFGDAPPGDDTPPAGLDALRGIPDVASVAVPDLYAPVAPPGTQDVATPTSTAGAAFAPCAPVPGTPPTEPPPRPLPGLELDPALPEDRTRIVEQQRRLVDVAAGLGVVALLDVPPGLGPAETLAWRAEFDSSFAAAYHGWPLHPDGGLLVPVPPSAHAAGMIADLERTRGVPYGPARVPLTGVVDVGTGDLDDRDLGELHRAGINVLVRDRDGIVVTAARTLSRDRAWRQLTARRVVTQLERTVAGQLGWVAFEPATDVLRATLRTVLDELLAGFQRAGAFAGATGADSWFVRLPPPSPGAEEQVLCEIGVAPSEPVEYVLLRVLRSGDGALRVAAGDD